MANNNEVAVKFHSMIREADAIAIFGHIRPDGDCVGSTLGLYNYILTQNPEKQVHVYLETFTQDFMFLSGADKVIHEVPEEGKQYDLGISLDCSDTKRHGAFGAAFQNAKHTICVDHHVSNQGFGELCYIVPDASSTCEVICDLLDMEKLTKEMAECLFLGIIHDTGVFKYSCTGRKTMELAGRLIEFGINATQIIDETFYKKSYKQNLLMAKTILQSRLYADNRVILGVVTDEMFREFQADRMDTEGIVEQLRLTDGVEVAIFVYQSGEGYKFSLRSKTCVDVSVIANSFGGGGHVRAAGFEYKGDLEKGVETLLDKIKEQLA
jgi:phosphoesterase RecJ-like protein